MAKKGTQSLQPSKIDPCLYYCPEIIFLVYINDCLLFALSDDLINQAIKDIRMTEPQFKMEDQGNVNNFLGIQVQCKLNGEIVLTQPHLIATILADLHLQQKKVLVRKTPALSTILLHKDPHMAPEFNYRSVIGNSTS